jgi:hypothetical protein
MYIEFVSPEDCRLYDERGELVQQLQPQGNAPTLQTGPNEITFHCTGTAGFRSRAEITVITEGPPLKGCRPANEIDWSRLQHSDPSKP